MLFITGDTCFLFSVFFCGTADTSFALCVSTNDLDVFIFYKIVLIPKNDEASGRKLVRRRSDARLCKNLNEKTNLAQVVRIEI